jgi:hypothetical protein
MNKLKFIAVGLVLSCFAVSAQQNRYWISPTSGNWSDANNWSTTLNGQATGGVPTTIDNVIFSGSDKGDCNINSNININKITTTDSYASSIRVNSNNVSVGTGGIQHTSGTIEGGSATISLTGDLLIDAPFISTNSMLVLAGGLTVTSDQFFNANEGKVLINSNGSTSISKYCTFNSLELYGQNQNVNVISAPEGIKVIDEFSIDANSGAIQLNALKLTLGGDFKVLDKWLLGTSKVEFVGYKEQKIIGNQSSMVDFFDLRIDKLSGDVITKEALRIYNQLELIDGNLKIGSLGSVLITSGASLEGGSNRSYIEGNCTKSGSSDFVFHLGANGVYHPLAVSNLSNTTEVSCQYIHASTPSSNNLSQPLAQIDECSYWIFSNSSNATMNLNFFLDNVNGCMLLSDTGDYEIAKLNNNQSWTLEPSTVSATTLSSGLVNPKNTFTLASSSMNECVDGALYWVGENSSSWQDPLNWSGSSGGEGGYGVPCTQNTAVFDENSIQDCDLSADVTISKVLILPEFAGEINTNGNALNIIELFK